MRDGNVVFRRCHDGRGGKSIARLNPLRDGNSSNVTTLLAGLGVYSEVEPFEGWKPDDGRIRGQIAELSIARLNPLRDGNLPTEGAQCFHQFWSIARLNPLRDGNL